MASSLVFWGISGCGNEWVVSIVISISYFGPFSFCLFILSFYYMLVFVLSYYVIFYLLHYCPLESSLFSNERHRQGRSGWEWWWEGTERIREGQKSQQDILCEKKISTFSIGGKSFLTPNISFLFSLFNFE